MSKSTRSLMVIPKNYRIKEVTINGKPTSVLAPTKTSRKKRVTKATRNAISRGKKACKLPAGFALINSPTVIAGASRLAFMAQNNSFGNKDQQAALFNETVGMYIPVSMKNYYGVVRPTLDFSKLGINVVMDGLNIAYFATRNRGIAKRVASTLQKMSGGIVTW